MNKISRALPFLTLIALFFPAVCRAEQYVPTPLHWAPPALTTPTTIQLGTGPTTTTMDTTKDYILVLPNQKKNGTTKLVGGHNIVIKGGYITIPSGASSVDQKAIRITGATGTVHIEGVLIDASGGGESDGIYIDAPEAIVQLEKLRVVGLHGTEATNHSDVIQAHGGHRELRIDQFTGSSNYQGFFFGEHDAPGKFGPIYIRNTDLAALPGADSRTLIWMASETHDWLMNYTVTFDNVWVKPLAGNSVFSVLKPKDTDPAPWTAVADHPDGIQIFWPGVPNKIHGSVWNIGDAIMRDAVPEGEAGLNYVSPGYESLASATPTPTPTTFLPGDINQDHIVDLTDYSILASQFFRTGTNLSADINKSGSVDLTDYSLLVSNFFKSN